MTSILLIIPDKFFQQIVALFVSICSVITWREAGPHWEPDLNYLSYTCSWEVFLCVVSLFLMDMIKTSEQPEHV